MLKNNGFHGRHMPLLGPNLVVNGDFDADLSNWLTAGAPTFTWTSSGASVRRNVFGDLAYQPINCVVGTKYRITVTVTSGTNARIGFNQVVLGGFTEVLNSGAVGTYSVVLTATAAVMNLILTCSANGLTSVFDNISIREVN
jgi:hypothetical protein